MKDYVRVTAPPTPVPTASPAPEPFVFRGFCWGDSIERITAQEGNGKEAGPVEGTADGNYILYDSSAVGMKMELTYSFCVGGLYSIRYQSVEDYRDIGEAVRDYKKLLAEYEKKYGKHYDDFDEWDDANSKEWCRDLYQAIADGHLVKIRRWFLNNGTNIRVSLGKTDGAVTVEAVYESRSYRPTYKDYSGEI